ncbi:MAG: flagellar motor protein MotA [Hyphomicrobiales bacterium]|nr:flagellar motor protein MotA [Hyphomicrobiales bacterium]
MGVFVVLAGLISFILIKPIQTAFMANPGLNGLIVGVLVLGILLAFRQVVRLFPEIRWMNDWANGTVLPVGDDPVLLATVARSIGPTTSPKRVSAQGLRTMLDSVGLRLDEARDVSRYLTGLLIFLGLLGTFWGLLETVTSVGKVIQSMKSGNDAVLMFEALKSGLSAPLQGMGISFSSSLFGLAGSLVLGFLDLQSGQAQNRFYNELEDWLAETLVDVSTSGETPQLAVEGLARGINHLVDQMRQEQQMLRDWVEAQAARDANVEALLRQLVERGGKL